LSLQALASRLAAQKMPLLLAPICPALKAFGRAAGGAQIARFWPVTTALPHLRGISNFKLVNLLKRKGSLRLRNGFPVCLRMGFVLEKERPN